MSTLLFCLVIVCLAAWVLIFYWKILPRTFWPCLTVVAALIVLAFVAIPRVNDSPSKVSEEKYVRWLIDQGKPGEYSVYATRDDKQYYYYYRDGDSTQPGNISAPYTLVVYEAETPRIEIREIVEKADIKSLWFTVGTQTIVTEIGTLYIPRGTIIDYRK